MSHNWNYVIAGYAIVTGTLTSYAVWLRVRIRRRVPVVTGRAR